MGQFSVLGSIAYYVGTFGLAGAMCKTKVRNKYVRLLLILIPPVILATFRYNIGYDYGSYIWAYELAFGNTYGAILGGYKIGDPIAYYLLTKFATIFHSERIFLMLLALCALVPAISYILEDWNDEQTQSLMIFIYLFSPFIFSFSACKQGIALCILMGSLKYVYDRKPVKFALCVLCAFLFHSSAIAFSLVYFFLDNQKRLSSAKKLLIICGCLFLMMNLQLVLGNIMGGRFESYATDEVAGKNRTFWLYTAMALFFVLNSKELVAIDQRNELLIMMLVVGAMCQFLGFSNAFAKRIGEYFMMAQVFLLPQIIYLFQENSRIIVKYMVCTYIVAMFYFMSPTASSGMGFVPYQYKLW